MINEVKGVELTTTFDNVLVEVLDNKFLPEKTESGLILPQGLHHSQETGDFEVSDQFIKTGGVKYIGSNVTTVAVGDVIYFDVATATPIPFGNLNNFVLNERSILAKVVQVNE